MIFNGKRFSVDDTPEILGMQQDDYVEVHVLQPHMYYNLECRICRVFRKTYDDVGGG
jgi:hypothetical protein